VNVDDSSRIVRDDLRRDQLEIAGKHDEVDRVLLEHIAELHAIGALRCRMDGAHDAASRCTLEGPGVRAIARDEHDVAASAIAEPFEVFQNRLQIRTAARREHCDTRSHRGFYVARH